MPTLKVKVDQRTVSRLKALAKLIRKNKDLPKKFRKGCKKAKGVAQAMVYDCVATWEWRYDNEKMAKRVGKVQKEKKKKKKDKNG